MSNAFDRRRTVRLPEAQRRIATGWRIGLSPTGAWRVFNSQRPQDALSTLDRNFALNAYLELTRHANSH